MRKLLIIPLCLFIITACSRNSHTTLPSNAIPDQPTTDFREAYTGDSLVDIAMRRSYMREIYYNDTAWQVRVRFRYSLADTVNYYIQGKVISSLPALNMAILDSLSQNMKNHGITDHKWGVVDTAQGKLIYSETNQVAIALIQNSGGFYGADSIYFLHIYGEPKLSWQYFIRGKRIK